MKRSFFDRLAGGTTDGYDTFDDDLPPAILPGRPGTNQEPNVVRPNDYPATAEGQLPVDLYQTPSDIIVRAFVAGVRLEELSVSIRRDMVDIEGSRMERSQIAGPDYFTRELFWGSFARSVLLPEEVDVEASSAVAKDGLLIITMPKLDKARQTKLKVKAG